MRRAFKACWLGIAFVCYLLWSPSPFGSRAEQRASASATIVPWALDVGRLHGGIQIAEHAQMYEDRSGQAPFAEIASAAFAERFVPRHRELAFGFTSSAMWLRFQANNPSDIRASWLLELAYPHLDHVALYVVHANGKVDAHETGDMLPFSHREIAQPDFLFTLENQPRESVTCYLRVATSGTMSLPLTAWTIAEYFDHQTRAGALLWMFFGALIMMALYNAAVFSLIRQGEYVTQAGLLISMCAVAFTLNGQTFQYLLPNHPLLANKAINVFLALALAACTLSCSQVVARIEGYASYKRAFQHAALLALALALFDCFAPKELGLRASIAFVILYVVSGVAIVGALTGRSHPQLRLYHLSWLFLLAGVPLSVLAHVGVVPPWPIFTWAAHIGCVMQGIFTSLALAARVKVMGDHLSGLNDQLSSNIVNLRSALTRTEEANQAAQRATKAKDEFMATMSHELRTPLNAIINVPQGLLEDFIEARSAVCQECQTDFLLETGDVIDASSVCLECQQVGRLVEGTATKYLGDPAHTAHFLRKIERSGDHLLHMVNGVLDFSKLQAGRLDLTWSELDLAVLVREVIEEMSVLAHQKGLQIALELPERQVPRTGDAVRIKQVLLNLLANAIKFSENAGTITIAWRWDGEADVISVSDQGIGIAPEDHARIFAGFEQVHKGDTRKYGGTGLGLSISRTLVRMHGGELWTESALGHGANFIFRLPRTKPATTDATPSA